MRRILLTCGDFRIGGHSSYTLNLARALRKRGYRVGVWVPEPFGELYPDFLDNCDELIVQRRGLESRRAYLQRVLSRISRFSPDVLINNVVACIQATLPLLNPKLVRLVVVHSIHPRELQICRANEQWLDTTVAVADNIARYLSHDSGDCAPVVTIPVGLNVPGQPPHHLLSVRPLRLLYVGRLEPEKNLPALLEIVSFLAKEHAEFSLKIVGSGSELPSFRSAVTRAGLKQNVNFLGILRPGEVAQVFKANDFLLLTSHYEGTPHAVLEAMAHGLVVLASGIKGATDCIITHGVNGFLCAPNRPQDYARILTGFIQAPESFAGVSRAAWETVQARYGADKIAATYERLFSAPAARNVLATQPDLSRGPQLPPALVPHFPGLMRQWKHRLADIWRSAVHGQMPVPVTAQQVFG